MWSVRSLIALGTVVMLTTACHDSPSAPAAVEPRPEMRLDVSSPCWSGAYTIAPSSVVLEVGQTATFYANMVAMNPQGGLIGNISWSTGNSAVATAEFGPASDIGVVTARGGGTTCLQFENTGLFGGTPGSGYAVVTVREFRASISGPGGINIDQVDGSKSEQYTLTAIDGTGPFEYSACNAGSITTSARSVTVTCTWVAQPGGGTYESTAWVNITDKATNVTRHASMTVWVSSPLVGDCTTNPEIMC